jgi:hypothetical protein
MLPNPDRSCATCSLCLQSLRCALQRRICFLVSCTSNNRRSLGGLSGRWCARSRLQPYVLQYPWDFTSRSMWSRKRHMWIPVANRTLSEIAEQKFYRARPCSFRGHLIVVTRKFRISKCVSDRIPVDLERFAGLFHSFFETSDIVRDRIIPSITEVAEHRSIEMGKLIDGQLRHADVQHRGVNLYRS